MSKQSEFWSSPLWLAIYTAAAFILLNVLVAGSDNTVSLSLAWKVRWSETWFKIVSLITLVYSVACFYYLQKEYEGVNAKENWIWIAVCWVLVFVVVFFPVANLSFQGNEDPNLKALIDHYLKTH